MDYDVIILGGGIIGCAVAYELSKYSLNIALIEKDYDIADDVALINSAVVYDGSECKDDLMAKLEFEGNKMLDQIAQKLNVPFARKPSLTIARNEEEEAIVQKIYERAIDRGVDGIRLLNSNETYDIEPELGHDIKKSLYSSNTGVICPYDLALSYGEIAFDNGVNFKLEEEVLDIKKMSKGYKIITSKNKFACNVVINTTPGENYSVDTSEVSYKNRSNLYYFVMDDEKSQKFNNIITNIGTNSNKVCMVPTVQGNTVAAVSCIEDLPFHRARRRVTPYIGELGVDNITYSYHWHYYNDNIIIDDSSIDSGYIKILGKHYGQVTMTPFIANMVCETVVSNLNCVPKKNFIDKRRESYRFRDLSNEERNAIIQLDKRYGRVVCFCQNITEGEVIDAIRRPLGARTVEGIKRRTGATLGNCQGTGCLDKIVKILARETNKKMTDIVMDSKNSNILSCRIKEFDSM